MIGSLLVHLIVGGPMMNETAKDQMALPEPRMN